MKKRLLITSIVMMLVVAVALSTATYAWFTSATEVTATSINMTAGTSQSSALGIAWAQGASNSDYGTTITAAAPSTNQTGGFQPAAPVQLNVATAPVFKTQYIDAQGKFKGAGLDTAVYRYTEDVQSNPSELIYVANLAASGAQTVYLTATIEGTGAALARIAVYEVNNTTFTYKGLLSATPAENDTAEGAITGTSQSASSLLTADSAAELNLGSFAAQGSKAYAIYIWLDGATFNEAESGKVASVALAFSTIKTSQGTVTEINAAA